jgi:predicted MFS family arabinose efflux permease
MASTIAGHTEVSPAEERKVIFASSLGTVFEWYDFYLFAVLAIFFVDKFYPPGNPTVALLASLATLAAGFLVRPFGALVFGRLGDLIGRKYTFLVTILLMGVSTAALGFLPTYAQIGDAAWIILLLLRLLQGLALGGEYGGAATYVAEHAPAGKRGLSTAWIQTTATLGLFLALMVIYVCRTTLSADDFKLWGWRIPFWLSIALLLFSIYIRLKLNESPVFQRMKAEGKGSKAPLTESFLRYPNNKYVLLALLGATAGQGVVWYTGQFQVLFFLQNAVKVDFQTTYILLAIGLLISTPFFIFFGWLSDKIGRKWIIMAGCLLGALTYFPLFNMLAEAANPALVKASKDTPVTVMADQTGGKCDFSFVASLIPQHDDHKKDCVKVKKQLTSAGINFSYGAPLPDAPIAVKVKDSVVKGTDAKEIAAALKAAGYPEKANPDQINKPMVVAIIVILMIYVTMVYGPIAALLVELFPTKIRYTSMSLPYHIGNGWFGGFLPFTATFLAISYGNIFQGLWYPVIIASMTFVIGALFLPETKDLAMIRDE